MSMQRIHSNSEGIDRTMSATSFQAVRSGLRSKLHSTGASVLPSWLRAAKPRRALLVLAAHLSLSVFSYALAVAVFTDSRGASWAGRVLTATVPWLLLLRLAGAAGSRLYRISLRHAGASDAIAIARAALLSSVGFAAFASWRFPLFHIPAALFLIDAAFLLILWGTLHFGISMVQSQRALCRKTGKRVVIVGAGDAGITLLKDLALDPDSPCRPVAVVDDDPEKWNRTLYGIPVSGGTKQLAAIATEKKAEEILICIPSATRSQMREILQACRATSIPVRTLPTLAEIMNGTVSRHDLRNPSIADLLQREEITLDPRQIREVVGDKVILVTGAGGSIGSELCRQIAAAGPKRLLLLDKAENSLFYANLEARERLDVARIHPLLIDLLDRRRLMETLAAERPEIIFHAAAHKHVGLLEMHPHEAIRNNVFGARNIAEAAVAFGAERFVNISTDKAVHPQSYMGLSKKITELCMQEMARAQASSTSGTAAGGSATRFMNVRFGNVAGSTGSVLRLFRDQIKKGGPIRVSDRAATRYFMTVPEAVNLILRAAALGQGGETFVFDMGEPLNIYELARTMSLFAGMQPDRDLSIEITGLAEGEKMAEELWEDWEHPVPTESGRILVIAEQNPLSQGIVKRIHCMEELLKRGEREGLLEYVHNLVPDFQLDRSAAGAVQVAGYANPAASPRTFVRSAGAA